MKLSEIIRVAAKIRTLVFVQPNAATARSLTSLGARYNSESGGYMLEVKEPPQKKGAAFIFYLAKPGRFSWVSVRRHKGLYQIDAFG